VRLKRAAALLTGENIRIAPARPTQTLLRARTSLRGPAVEVCGFSGRTKRVESLGGPKASASRCTNSTGALGGACVLLIAAAKKKPREQIEFMRSEWRPRMNPGHFVEIVPRSASIWHLSTSSGAAPYETELGGFVPARSRRAAWSCNTESIPDNDGRNAEPLAGRARSPSFPRRCARADEAPHFVGSHGRG